MLAATLAGVGDASLQSLVASSPTGLSTALRLLGVVVICFGLKREARLAGSAAVLGAVIVAVSFTLTGHTAEHTSRGVLGALLTFHLLVAAFWFGALVPLYPARRVQLRLDSGP